MREVVYVHVLQVRTLWRTETKKQRVDLILGVPIRISLGAKLAALKTFYGWVARVAIVCIHVDECPARHRHQEERSVLWFFFVAPHAACRSFAPGIVASVCVREAQYAHGRRSPWCELSFYLRMAGGVLGRGNHASTRSDILLCPKVRRSQEALGGRASPRGLHRSEVQ